MKEEFMRQRELFIKEYPIPADECFKAKPCPVCDGEGEFAESQCCGKSIVNGKCCLCGDDTGPTACISCNASGLIPMTDEDYDSLWENENISNSEIKNDNG